MSEPFALLAPPVVEDELLASVPQISEFSKAAARVELPQADVLEELAFEMVCNPHDPHGVLARFELTVFDYELICKLPLFEASRRAAADLVRTDPNYAARRKARKHLSTVVDRMAAMTVGLAVDPKDQLNAAKFLQSVAQADGAATTAAKKGGGGVNIQINLGTAVGQQLAQVLRVEDDQ